MAGTKTIAAVVVIGFAAVIVYSSLFTVNQTQQALVLQLGNPKRAIVEPGLNFKMPFIQNVEYYDSRILDLDPPQQQILLADQKRINVDAFARWKITDALEFRKRAVTFANFRQIFGNRLNSAVRGEMAKVSLADLLSDTRVEVMGLITNQMRSQAAEFGVEVIDVRVGRTDLPVETSQAVYNRMRSDRVKEAAQLRAEGEEIKAKIQAEADRERTVILAEANRQGQILRGEGEATRNAVLAEAFGRDAEFFAFYRSMEAYRDSLSSGTTMVLSPDSDFFRFFGRLPESRANEDTTEAFLDKE